MAVLESLLMRNARSHRSPLSLVPPTVRRMRFRFGEPVPMDHFFIRDSMPFSHFLALGSSLFPLGEDTIIRSVRKFKDEIEDPMLKKRVAGLLGQEVMHSQEHDRMNVHMLEQDTYPMMKWFIFDDDTRRGRFVIGLENAVGRKVHLGFTAMAEHVTATLAKIGLSDAELQAIPGDPDVWGVINWHMLEELEHKSVVFDLYKAMGGSEVVRIALGWLAVVGFYPIVVIGVPLSMLLDPAAWRRPLLALRQMGIMLKGPMSPKLVPELAKFTRPGFHPDDIDTEDLVQEWQLKLFGANGELVDRVR